MINDTFIDYGEDYLSSTMGNADGEFGYGTYFTQINDTTLYTINCNGDSINVYDLQSLEFTDLGVSIPNDIDWSACIASSATPTPRLYITGGYERPDYNPAGFAVKSSKMLNLDNLQWSFGFMEYSRSSHGCIVANDLLWAIGGSGRDSVETRNITNYAQNSWQERETLSLYCQLASFGITAVDKLIFIVGGSCTEMYTNTRSDLVVYIDSENMNSIRYYPYRLPYAVSGMSIMLIDDTIYGFGGLDAYNATILNSWMMLDVLSVHTSLMCILTCDSQVNVDLLKSPTMSPTASPTASPTENTLQFSVSLRLSPNSQNLSQHELLQTHT